MGAPTAARFAGSPSVGANVHYPGIWLPESETRPYGLLYSVPRKKSFRFPTLVTHRTELQAVGGRPPQYATRPL